MDDKKEYIQISKEDFEKIYKTVDKIIKLLKDDSKDLETIYEILRKEGKNLRKIISKNTFLNLDTAARSVNNLKSTITFHYLDLLDVKKILKKAKKEQIDKKQNG
jgi:DNA-directed RNA polymerase subunit F